MIDSLNIVFATAGFASVASVTVWSRGRRRTTTSPPPPPEDGAQVLDVMSRAVHSVSSQSTVEEVAVGLRRPNAQTVFAVIDGSGQAVGVLRWDDVLRVPHIERPALLVADLTRHAIVPGSADPSGRLVAAALADGGTAVVTDGDHAPVGLVSRGV